MSKMKDNLAKAAAVIVIVIVLAGAVFGWQAAYKSTEREVTATVEDKDRVCETSSGNGQKCQYLVFTDQGTFKVTDTWSYGNFSSSDTYGRLKEGNTYTFDVAGFRLPLMSEYPNIVSEPVKVKG